MSSTAADGRRPPNWASLLQSIAAHMRSPTEKDFALNLITSRQYLEAAEVIRADVSDVDFGHVIHSELREPNFLPSDLHKYVRSLDLKVVVTTNYDTIYETLCRDGDGSTFFNSCTYYEDHLVNDLRSTRRVIVKAHGSVVDASKIVLTRGEYFEVRKRYGNFYDVMDALFTTNTILFVGYSLDDPDIRMVLENVNISAPSVAPHYAIVEAGRHPALKQATKAAYNVELLEHTAGQYGEIPKALKILSEKVAEYRNTH